MLSFDELFECLVLLIACRMSGNFSWQTAVLHWPFLRPMIAWLELTIADVREYAEMMNRSISDDQERQVALSMEHHGCPPGPPFSAISISVLHWFRRMWQRVSHDSMFYFHSAETETGVNFFVVGFGQLRLLGCEPSGNGDEVS